MLDSENTTLQQSLGEYQKKYAEAIVTLKEVQNVVSHLVKILNINFKCHDTVVTSDSNAGENYEKTLTF